MKEEDLIDLAAKMAHRSPVRRFQTGAAIFKDGEVLATGWSHATGRNMACYRSMHAELHAISRMDLRDTVGSIIAIATLSRKSGNRTDGTPCLFCFRNIQKFGIAKIICTASGGGIRVIDPLDIDCDIIEDQITAKKKKYLGHLC